MGMGLQVSVCLSVCLLCFHMCVVHVCVCMCTEKVHPCMW